MSVRIYYHNNTSGQLGGSDRRTVILQGTANVLFTPFGFDYEWEIKRWLKAQNFDVKSVKVAVGWTLSGITLTIELQVLNQFTAEQARLNATSVIESIVKTVGIVNRKVFSQVRLEVAKDYYRASGNPDKAAGPTGNYEAPDPAPNSNFLDSFASGLGVSVPMAALAGGILLFIALRK